MNLGICDLGNARMVVRPSRESTLKQIPKSRTILIFHLQLIISFIRLNETFVLESEIRGWSISSLKL